MIRLTQNVLDTEETKWGSFNIYKHIEVLSNENFFEEQFNFHNNLEMGIKSIYVAKPKDIKYMMEIFS